MRVTWTFLFSGSDLSHFRTLKELKPGSTEKKARTFTCLCAEDNAQLYSVNPITNFTERKQLLKILTRTSKMDFVHHLRF
jgi:hypothetical protein